jgi:polyferredoxin
MKEIGRPRGLIDYVTLEDCKAEAAGQPPRPAWKVLLRPRTLIYFGIWGAIGLAMLFALGTRNRIDISAAPDRNPPYMLLSDGSVRNSFTVKLRNMSTEPRRMKVELEGLPGAVMWTSTTSRQSATRAIETTVSADATDPLRLYIAAPPGTGEQTFAFHLVTLDQEAENDIAKVTFSGPGANQ